MASLNDTLRILPVRDSSSLSLDLQAFLLDAQARNLAPGSVRFYRQKLKPLVAFLEGCGVRHTEDVQVGHLRQWLVRLQQAGHTPGGVHAFYRSAKAWFSWLTAEEVISANPMARVRSPRVPEEQLEPVTVDEVRALLAVCDPRCPTGARDRAILLCLWDTGCRASELVALDVGDVDLATGAVVVRCGKGRKLRVTFLGVRARRELLRYLRTREGAEPTAPLFATVDGGRLKYAGLRDIIRRRAQAAGIVAPCLHAFRRAFALDSLRNGADVISLRRLMGHSGLGVLQRYLRQTQDDLQRVHEQTGPVDRLL